MLTAKQIMPWVLRSPAPWRISQLASALKASAHKSFSFSQALAAVGKIQVAIIAEVRDVSLLKSESSYHSLMNAWGSSRPSRNTLVQLSNILSKHGASIRQVSPDWNTLVMAASLNDWFGISGYVISEKDYTGDVGLITGGGVAIGSVLMGVGAFTAQPELFWLGADIAASSGAFGVGYGVGDIAGSALTDSGSPATAYGQQPSGSDDGDVLQTPEIIIVGPTTLIQGDASQVADSPPLDPSDSTDVPPPTGSGDEGEDGGNDSGGDGGG